MQTSKTPSSRTTAATSSGKDALTLLAADHREVRKLFKAYEKLIEGKTNGDERFEIAQQICEMLTTHAAIEEAIFYPAMREAVEADSLLDEAEVEHASVKDLIDQIAAMDPDDDLYDAKVTVLGEYVEHHVNEEENELFPKAKRSNLDLTELGTALQQLKDDLAVEDVPAW